jgi:hypothetical protein
MPAGTPGKAYERSVVRIVTKPAVGRAQIDRALAEHGQAPRGVVRRYAGLSRKAVQRHRDECLHRNHETKGRAAWAA